MWFWVWIGPESHTYAHAHAETQSSWELFPSTGKQRGWCGTVRRKAQASSHLHAAAGSRLQVFCVWFGAELSALHATRVAAEPAKAVLQRLLHGSANIHY